MGRDGPGEVASGQGRREGGSLNPHTTAHHGKGSPQEGLPKQRPRLRRAQLEPIVIDGPQPGGQLTITTDVENYPGFSKGIMGPEMMNEFRAQAERFGTQVRFERVTKVDFSKRPFKLWLDEELIESKTVIIAAGARVN